MANNQNVNKVVYAGTTLIDLTGDDVTAGDVLSGKKFHLKSGAAATGTMPNIGAISGILKGDGQGGVSAATAGTDYLAPNALTPYRTAAAQDEIDAGLVSAVAAQSFIEAQKTRARANIGAASEWTLLWENASPDSNFAEQIITIDNITNYDSIFIRATHNSGIFNATGDSALIFISIWSTGFETYERYFNISGTLLQFTHAVSYNIENNTSGIVNGFLKPLAIYGLKTM